MNAIVPPDTPGTISAAPMAIPLKNTEAGCCLRVALSTKPSCCELINGQPRQAKEQNGRAPALVDQTYRRFVSLQQAPDALHQQVRPTHHRQQAVPKVLQEPP